MRNALVVAATALWFQSIATIASAEEQAIGATGGEARQADGFTIDAALAVMRGSHPLLRAAGAAIRAAEANAVTAGHWTNPVIDATYMQATHRATSSYDPLGAPVAGVTQFIELAGVPAARRRSAEREALATRADRDQVARDLEWTVREAFVHLAASHERQRILLDMRADLEHAANIVRARVGAGMAPRYDDSRMELALAQARSEADAALADLAQARGDLDAAVGPRADELRGAPRLDLLELPPPPPLPAALESARHERPDIVAAQRRAEGAENDIHVAKRAIFSGVGLRAAVGYGQAPRQFDVGGGLVVPFPLFERGQGYVRAAEARAEGSRAVADALVTAASQRTLAAHTEYTRRLDALARFRGPSGPAADAMRGEAEAAYREARLSVLELVDAYRSIRDGRLQLVKLAEDAQMARISLGRESAKLAP